jgi:hypothetical protein
MALSYKEQLIHPLWIKKSEEIKERDDHKCRICGDSLHWLNVHHLCYLPDLLLWEYDDELMITTCRIHHEILNIELPKLAGIIAFQALSDNIDLVQLFDLIKNLNNGSSLKKQL